MFWLSKSTGSMCSFLLSSLVRNPSSLNLCWHRDSNDFCLIVLVKVNIGLFFVCWLFMLFRRLRAICCCKFGSWLKRFYGVKLIRREMDTPGKLGNIGCIKGAPVRPVISSFCVSPNASINGISNGPVKGRFSSNVGLLNAVPGSSSCRSCLSNGPSSCRNTLLPSPEWYEKAASPSLDAATPRV